MFVVLRQMEIGGKMLRLIKLLYTEPPARIKIGQLMSAPFLGGQQYTSGVSTLSAAFCVGN